MFSFAKAMKEPKVRDFSTRSLGKLALRSFNVVRAQVAELVYALA